MTNSATAAPCPRCNAPTPADASFCPRCGAPLAGALCVRCETPLTPGASFCHRCGMPAGGQLPAAGQTPVPAGGVPPSRAPRDYVPWTVGGIAALALLGTLVVRGLTREPATGTAVDGVSGTRPIRAADISQLSPEERADRLYNRVMQLAAQEKRDSVAFFAPMAIEAYRMLGPLNDDQQRQLDEITAALTAARERVR